MLEDEGDIVGDECRGDSGSSLAVGLRLLDARERLRGEGNWVWYRVAGAGTGGGTASKNEIVRGEPLADAIFVYVRRSRVLRNHVALD